MYGFLKFITIIEIQSIEKYQVSSQVSLTRFPKYFIKIMNIFDSTKKHKKLLNNTQKNNIISQKKKSNRQMYSFNLTQNLKT